MKLLLTTLVIAAFTTSCVSGRVATDRATVTATPKSEFGLPSSTLTRETSSPRPSPPVQTTPTTAACVAAPMSGANRLTLEALRNAEYPAYPEILGTIRLTDGELTIPAAAGLPASDVTVYSLSPSMAFGDLDGDGVEDAAVTLIFNPPGTYAHWTVHPILNQDGSPVVAGAVRWSDRDSVNALSIACGVISADLTIHGPRDPGCCPSINKIERYRLVQGQLELQP